MLTSSDKKILNAIQADLPLSSHPFADLAKTVNLSEKEVINRLQFLKKNGYIRRIGPFFDSVKLGYTGTLIALHVKKEYMESVVAAVNAFSGATHNYEREGKYNLWFTLLTPSDEVRTAIIHKINNLPGVEEVMNLVSHKKYKVNVKFNLK